MAKNNTKAKKGFTIIEVVLVLAIAGLIFLMVFVALPALQRSQRDTQRRDDMARFLSQLQQYQANNRGKVPASTTAAWNGTLNETTNLYDGGFIGAYLNAGGDVFTDPDGSNYFVAGICNTSSNTECSTSGSVSAKVPNAALVWNDNKHEIYIYTNAKCDGENAVYVKNAPNQVAVRYKLEGAGIYCGSL